MKILAEQISSYMNAWPLGRDWYYDGYDYEIWSRTFTEDKTGLLTPRTPGQMVSLELFDADVMYQGKSEKHKDASYRLSTLVKKWVNAQSSKIIMLNVPKNKVKDLLLAAQSLGCKELKD